jgi:putative membrane protein
VPAIINYVIHLVLASGLIMLFLWVYTTVTPIDEFLLIRQGNTAAALSLGGALIGFSLTIASSVIHTADYREFLAWAAGAMVVQLLVYAVTTRVLRMSKEHIESGNAAFGGLMGAISLSVGAVNAACIS